MQGLGPCKNKVINMEMELKFTDKINFKGCWIGSSSKTQFQGLLYTAQKKLLIWTIKYAL